MTDDDWVQAMNQLGGSMGTSKMTNQMACSGGSVGNYQYWPYPTQCYPTWPQVQYVYQVVAPTECSGGLHVFPCAKCGECKCGQAKLTKGKKS